MKTDLDAAFLATDNGKRANEILRSCVHCGFCNATCPTYQVTGDELDGPRGRIYLVRDLLEGAEDASRVTTHLDRCLTCRACETTCPSGVQYGELVEIARNTIGPHRSGFDGMLRSVLKRLIPDTPLMSQLLKLGRPFRRLLPERFAHQVPASVGEPYSQLAADASVIVLGGCVQGTVTPATIRHLVALLEKRGVTVSTLEGEVCCGSLDLHLGDESAALALVRTNVDLLHARLEGVEAIVSSASGCGVTVKDYGRLLAGDPVYRDKAQEVSDKVMDAGEYLAQIEDLRANEEHGSRVAWHSPCTLQHGQKITGLIEGILGGVGYDLVQVRDTHLCCGSAGTYSILQHDISSELKRRKLEALQMDQPEVIATANVGCQTHLASGAGVPVVHWIELLN